MKPSAKPRSMQGRPTSIRSSSPNNSNHLYNSQGTKIAREYTVLVQALQHKAMGKKLQSKSFKAKLSRLLHHNASY